MDAFQEGIDTPGSEAVVAVRHRHKDGSWRIIEATGKNLLHDPAVEGIVVASRDITERVEKEELLRQAQNMEIVGQLTGGVAHDFNNLLTVMLGSLELLKDETEPDSKADQLIDQAVQAANRAASVTRELLAFSRRQALQPKVLNLDRVVSGTLDMLRGTLGEGITIEMRSLDELWSCNVDPVQFETALRNLAVNAGDAMPEGGQLIIELGHAVVPDGDGDTSLELNAGDYVTVTVSDTGTGMTPETVERACEPFFTTKEVGLGSGLGLSMVYGFVKQSGGDLRIESTQDEGTRVTAYIPRA